MFDIYLKATDVDAWGKRSVKTEVGGELPAAVDIETLPGATGRIRTQKQTNR